MNTPQPDEFSPCSSRPGASSCQVHYGLHSRCSRPQPDSHLPSLPRLNEPACLTDFHGENTQTHRTAGPPTSSPAPDPGSPVPPCSSRLKGPPPRGQDGPSYAQARAALALQPDPRRHAQARRGLKGSASRQTTDTPPLGSSHFIEGLRGRVEKLGGRDPTSFSQPGPARTRAVGEQEVVYPQARFPPAASAARLRFQFASPASAV